MSKVDSTLTFSPVWWAPGGDIQTILGHLTNRVRLWGMGKKVRILLPDGDVLVGLEHGPDKKREPKGVVLLMHGLAGDARSPYMVSAARRFVDAGYIAVRLNHRGAGAGAGLAQKTYNSGLSGDVSAVVDALKKRHPHLPLIAVGYSMSGNMLLKYLGESGQGAADQVAGAVAVCPPIELKATLEQIDGTALYDRRFTRISLEQLYANARRRNENGATRRTDIKSLRQVDEEITVPVWGFDSPDHYYSSASSAPVVGNIAVRTAVLTAEDDPVVPARVFDNADWSPAVSVLMQQGGGHLGFLSRDKTPFGDRRWLDYALVSLAEGFVKENAAHGCE